MIKLVMHSLGQTGVPIFMMISGYYGVRYRKSRLADIVVQCFLYTFVFYVVASFFVPGIRGLRMAVLQMFGMSQLWFVYSYVLLYIVSDGVNTALDRLSCREYTMIVVLMLYVTIGLWIARAGATNPLVMFEYYIIGRYVRRFMPPAYRRRMAWMVLPALLLYLSPLLAGIYGGHVSGAMAYVNKYYNPCLILLSVSCVVAADTMQTHVGWINYVASSMLAVYMIHESAYLPAMAAPLFGFGEFNALRIAVMMLVVMTGAVLVDKLRQRLQGMLFDIK